MKKLAIVGLVSMSMWAATNDAFAQRRGGVGRGRGGVYVGVGGGYYGGGYYGRGGYYGGGFYPGYGFGYYSFPNSYYGDTAPYYSSAPISNYSDAVTQAPSTVRQSFYADPGSATVIITVPDGNTQIWFDDRLTQQRGLERSFSTPPLQQAGTYTIKARWMENGLAVERRRTVQVQPGQTAHVDFRGGSTNSNSESLATPKNTAPK